MDKYRILYVDDDPEWSRHAKEAINKTSDWEITTAGSISDVTQLIREERGFEVAIVDLGIGGGSLRWDPKSGEEIARRLSERGVKIGLLSAQDSEVSRKIAKDLNAPLFDKGHINSFLEVATKTLNYGLPTGSERMG